MHINEIRDRIVDFASKRALKNNFELTPELHFVHLNEEVGEVARQLSNLKMRPEMFDEGNLKEEIVDVLLETILLAHACDVDLESEINRKIDSLYRKHGF